MADVKPLVKFLKKNLMEYSNLPRSYRASAQYWAENHKPEDDQMKNLVERALTTFGLNVYDGACWQIGVTVGDPTGNYGLAEHHSRAVWLHQTSGLQWRPKPEELEPREGGKFFNFNGVRDVEHPWIYRWVIDIWSSQDNKFLLDPLTKEPITGWWGYEPVCGENAWAQLLGPLQSYKVHRDNAGKVPAELDALEVQLAIRAFRCFEVMQNGTGSVYYGPRHQGFESLPGDNVSTENNASLYAGLHCLRSTLKEVPASPDITALIQRVEHVIKGIEYFVRSKVFNNEKPSIEQGGTVNGVELVPSGGFALDCQTWGLLAWGEAVEHWFGNGKAFGVWQHARQTAGFFDDGKELCGVGYSDENSSPKNAKLVSGEWTLGAIITCKVLAEFYKVDADNKYTSLQADIDSMTKYVTQNLIESVGDGQQAVKYASKRYAIDFGKGGWWANSIPSTTSTAWMVMLQKNFNPFYYGGEMRCPEFLLKDGEEWHL
eukprot:TRINITY_DN540_c0_g1_i1.p1 TRINITY_DN540_c0_g1~~TRINITY_DN540_c0_g1_i1.p1  ORF type:complete len:488 (+),score=133.80 TRINITY_DN540_c0_g1_i1:215-1678(+)